MAMRRPVASHAASSPAMLSRMFSTMSIIIFIGTME
jgi:hypothetical protein